MGRTEHVVVVGGGIIGLACAHFLVKTGWRVTVIDKYGIGKGCSHGNCGLVCPSHVLPMAEPGAVRQAIKALFQSNAAFRIKPRLDMSLWMWLWKFARRCNSHDMLTSGQAIQSLLQSSMSLYHELMAEQDLQCEWETRGLLFVYRNRQAMEAYSETNQLLCQAFQEPAIRFEGDSVCQVEPALKPGLAGGWLYEHDAHLRPDKLISSWREQLAGRGVEFREQCDFHRFIGSADRASKVVTSNGDMTASAFVVSTGALTPLLSKHLGCRIPIQPGKGYSLTMPRPANCPKIPMIFPEHRVAVTPMKSAFRLGSIMEFAGYDATIPADRIRLLTEGSKLYLRESTCDLAGEQWSGWRPMTWDSLPIIDRSPRYSNVWIAAGHNMLGLSMAPATGKLVSELIAGREGHVDPKPYSVARF